jgi:hypothetical protein
MVGRCDFLAPNKTVKPGGIVRQGNLPHKGANCMPVPRSGFDARKAGAAGAALKICAPLCTKMTLRLNGVMHFGALAIFVCIAWLNLEQFPL